MHRLGLSGRIASYFINSKLTPLIIMASLILGLFAVLSLPREEEPQIIVPMVDVFVSMPGATAKEVEKRVTTPMEKLLWEIPGVEYIYSTSSHGQSMAIVRFYVGQDIEKSLVKLRNKLDSNLDIVPHGASMPIVKPRSIDDVPILALTFWGKGYTPYQLRRVAAKVDDQIKEINDVSDTTLIGGQRKQVRVTLDPGRMAGFGVAPAGIAAMLAQANRQLTSGSFASGNREFAVETGDFLASTEDVGAVVVATSELGRPVYLRDVAVIEEGPEEPINYVMFGTGPAARHRELPRLDGNVGAVTLAVAKRQGTNAIVIADQALEKVEGLKGRVIPEDVHVTVTRNYGETATEKSNELLLHMMIAVISVTLLIALALGKRESLVVAVAVPVTLALTLLVFKLYGYTLNRITLFALIFSIGILVDDAIVVVENMVRHFRMSENHGRPLVQVASEAVDEVGNPTILATFTVIAAILPMAFVGGLMGPYMRPIPVGASAAMIFSLLIAFIISPWAAFRLLRREADRPAEGPGHDGPVAQTLLSVHDDSRQTGVSALPMDSGQTGVSDLPESEAWTTKVYRRVMTPLIRKPEKRMAFLGMVVVLLLAAMSLVALKVVTVKMLPFDNKSEFQVIIDMPEGTTLEQTATVTNAIGRFIKTVPEVTDYESYVGTASPYNFNGLVRHYFLRNGPNVADLQVNLVGKHDRNDQSHDIAKRIRPKIQEIAAQYGANVKIAEVPPGPPVLQTLVAEVYGPDYDRQIQVAGQIKHIFNTTEGVADVDWYVEDLQPKYRFVLDKEKAALNGVSTEQATQTLRLAVEGVSPELAHQQSESEDVNIMLRLPLAERSSVDDLKEIQVQSAGGQLVPIGELVTVEDATTERSIYHKNLMPVVYVTADVSGRQESPVYAILKMNKAIDKLQLPEGYKVRALTTRQPFISDKIAMKWDGEWHITYEVFRDLGIAFAAVLIIIYILVVAWFQSFTIPLVIMAPIPLTLVGILPGHALMGAFFTATSMIGFIAGAGIIVRNSIILVDFIELRIKQGMPLQEAVVDAGAVRFRPMLLTAAAVMVGAGVILFDPIFQGLAISLMAGEVASTFLSRMTVPVLYFMVKSRMLKQESRVQSAEFRA